MTKSTTTFVIVACALLVTCFGGGYYLLKTYAGPMIAQSKNAMDEAQAFAGTTDNAGCLAEASSRYKTDNDVTGGVKEMMFLTVCLKGSKPTPGFCDGVPSARDMIKTGPWQREQCGKIAGGAGTVRCPMVMGVVQNHCHPRG